MRRAAGPAIASPGAPAILGLQGVHGRPFVALDDLFDLRALDAIHDEICLALAQMPTGYTGGSHRAMGIMPSGCEAEALVDYQEVIRALDDAGFATFASLADDPAAIDAITDAVDSAPIVIADGHHRYETSLAFAAERPDLPGAQATLFYVVELVDAQLTVQPIHRLIAGLPGGTDVAAALSGAFDVEPTDDVADAGTVGRLVASGRLGLVTADGLTYLRPKVDDGRIDSAIFADALVALPPHELTHQHGVANAVRAVESGQADAAVLIRPVSVAQIQRVAHARERMQPKSTFFWPKPRTGAVFRSLK